MTQGARGGLVSQGLRPGLLIKRPLARTERPAAAEAGLTAAQLGHISTFDPRIGPTDH